MSYLVKNMTNHVIVISDLRAQIPPINEGYPFFDLELVAGIEDIHKSKDLREAFTSGKLQRVCINKIKITNLPQKNQEEKQQFITKIQHESINEDKLLESIKKIIRDEIRSAQNTGSLNPINDLMDLLRNKINNVDNDFVQGPRIDEATLANIQQRALEKLGNEIKTGGEEKVQRIKIKTSESLTNRANELD